MGFHGGGRRRGFGRKAGGIQLHLPLILQRQAPVDGGEAAADLIETETDDQQNVDQQQKGKAQLSPIEKKDAADAERDEKSTGHRVKTSKP
ncbi:MAG: hypothetical protein RBR20_05310 [Desulfobacterales bacterium]|nr:hypothetical protein [Desulfobacteraceae bacterium]MDY0311522.1 hypothetical protein [Desulfobacterales bacterium]